MKKVALSLVILGGLLNGFAAECKHLWFSQKQQDSLYVVDNTTKAFDTSKLRNIYGKLENGNIVQYTEMTDKKEYTSNFDDVKYVGCGSYERTDIKGNSDIRQYHSQSEINDKKYKEKLLRNYEQLNQK